MDEREYSGWTNRATWLINLWLNNDPGSQEAASEAAAEGGEDTLREMVEEGFSEALERGGMLADLITYALDQVNWGEIAHSFGEDEEGG